MTSIYERLVDQDPGAGAAIVQRNNPQNQGMAQIAKIMIIAAKELGTKTPDAISRFFIMDSVWDAVDRMRTMTEADIKGLGPYALPDNDISIYEWIQGEGQRCAAFVIHPEDSEDFFACYAMADKSGGQMSFVPCMVRISSDGKVVPYEFSNFYIKDVELEQAMCDVTRRLQLFLIIKNARGIEDDSDIVQQESVSLRAINRRRARDQQAPIAQESRLYIDISRLFDETAKAVSTTRRGSQAAREYDPQLYVKLVRQVSGYHRGAKDAQGRTLKDPATGKPLPGTYVEPYEARRIVRIWKPDHSVVERVVVDRRPNRTLVVPGTALIVPAAA